MVGLAFGWVVFHLIKSVDEYKLELLLTIALAMSAYALADALEFSAPIAVVLAGMLMGKHGRTNAMSEQTETRIDNFWELLDEILNAVLFLVIGLEMLVMEFTRHHLWASFAAIGIALLARWLTVAGIGGAGPAQAQHRPRRHIDSDLGRAAGSYLGGAGPVATAKQIAEPHHRHHLWRGGVLDLRSRFDGRAIDHLRDAQGRRLSRHCAF